MLTLTPELLVRAYTYGVFPMARSRTDDSLYWVDPHERGIFPLDGFKPSRSLLKIVRQGRFVVTIDHDFKGVMERCAEPTLDRPETWINDTIVDVFTELHGMGVAHSVECWFDDALVGGLYGLSLGGAFFGESMFSRMDDASKVALCHLVAHMRRGGYKLLDTQFVTDHLISLGAREIPKQEYLGLLSAALRVQGNLMVPMTNAEVAEECRAARPTA